jgi:hypothetical protein
MIVNEFIILMRKPSRYGLHHISGRSSALLRTNQITPVGRHLSYKCM